MRALVKVDGDFEAVQVESFSWNSDDCLVNLFVGEDYGYEIKMSKGTFNKYVHTLFTEGILDLSGYEAAYFNAGEYDGFNKDVRETYI